MSKRKAAPGDDAISTPPARSRWPSGIRVGVGGWTYAPWRGGMFYPEGLVQRRELEYASRQLNSIEINGTYYGAQKPATYAKWRDETPADFVFSVKAPMRIMQSKQLASTGHQVEDFIGGIVELGDKLGPIVWQFDEDRPVDRGAFSEFLDLLPARQGKHRLRHVLDVRVVEFVDSAYVALAREHEMATVFTDSKEHPSFADLTTDFVYARLMRSRTEIQTGYPDAELDRWAERALLWSEGGDPMDLPHIGAVADQAEPREVFLYFISSAKERNPAAAMTLLERLGAIRSR